MSAELDSMDDKPTSVAFGGGFSTSGPPASQFGAAPAPALSPYSVQTTVPSASQGAPLTLDDDILGGAPPPAPAGPASRPTPPPAPSRVDPHFKQVFDQFLATKKTCGEPTSGLTLEKFSEKLIKNRDDLMAKTGCREVKFTVYVKDGKAALKATPVKEE
jgi:hypothetical protein